MKGGNEVSEAVRAARAIGQGFVSEKTDFGATHFQAGTDLVGGITHSPLGELGDGGNF